VDGRVAQVYPFEEWERIEQKLAGLSTFNPTKKKFLDRVNYYGQMVEMDGQGRLLIPQLVRDSAQIKGEVAVLGNLTFLIVRNLEAFRQEIEEQPFTSEDEKTLDDLGI
jgi:MraZ protein